ncbi:MAG: hypothetical protein Fur0037_26380 [Planctomycetota bacterium]
MTPESIPEPKSVQPESVIIRPWPKVVFLYPTLICSVLFFLMSALWTGKEGAEASLGSPVLGNTFMVVFALNLLVFSFDFSRIKSITILVLLIAVGLGLAWANTKWQVLGWLGGILSSIDIRMNTSFYGFMSAILALILLLVLINTRFNYYEVNARELLHHHGYLGDVKRWSTDGMEMNKEIYDLVEFALLRSGRLIFLPSTSREAIVIDNVLKVNRIEERVKDLLSVVAVRFNQRPGPG